jgi:hypothetical protein
MDTGTGVEVRAVGPGLRAFFEQCRQRGSPCGATLHAFVVGQEKDVNADVMRLHGQMP